MNSNKPVSEQELKDYLAGKLSPEEEHRIEQQMGADEFQSEAMDGYLENKEGYEGFEQARQKFEHKHQLTTNNSNGWSTVSLILAGALVVAIGVIVYLMVFNKDPDQNKERASFSEPEKPIDVDEPSKAQQSNAQNYENMGSADPVTPQKAPPKEEQMTYEKTVEEQPPTIQDPAPNSKEDPVMVPPLESAEPIATQPISTTSDKVVHSNVKLAILYDLKVVDYAAFYSRSIKTRNMDVPTGTRAYSPDKTENPTEIKGPYIFVPYLGFLEKGMKAFRNNNFKAALDAFEPILEQYPDDVNVHFYSGLCYYNLGSYPKAVGSFNQVLADPIYSFDQEAKWHKTQTLIQMGKVNQARVLLKEIKEEGLFYAKRATKKLKDLNR